MGTPKNRIHQTILKNTLNRFCQTRTACTREELDKVGRKKKVEYDDPERSARFIETAERIQADDAEERFKEAMKQIVAFKPKRNEKSKDRS